MQKMSLPSTLQLTLKQHLAAADISDYDEIKNIMIKTIRIIPEYYKAPENEEED